TAGTPPAEAPSSPARILLVEDEQAVRAAVRRMLTATGYVVREATDGQEAIRSFSGADIDLVITDVVMPGGLTGAEVAQHLRRQRPDLPALFVTGYGVDVLEQRGIAIDGSTTAVLEKPFREAQLLEAVRRALAFKDD
ncbi:MAG: response regulator, partial [Acidimicrobiales bacterium]